MSCRNVNIQHGAINDDTVQGNKTGKCLQDKLVASGVSVAHSLSRFQRVYGEAEPSRQSNAPGSQHPMAASCP